jgi:GNAT superfamily N-acetyltransferase
MDILFLPEKYKQTGENFAYSVLDKCVKRPFYSGGPGPTTKGFRKLKMVDIIDENFNLHAWKIPSVTEGMKVFKSPGINYVDSGLSCDTFNIIHIRDGRKVLAENIIEAVDYYRTKQLAYCVWICKENLTKNVKAAIDRLKLKEQNLEPGMLLNLDNYKPVQNINHVNAVIGNDVKLIQDYADVVAKNWTPTDLNVLEYYNKAMPSILNDNTVKFSIYYQENNPVSVIELFNTNDKTVGLYGLATLEPYRGKGIGTALLTFALNKCKALGFSNVILQASEDGFGIYKKLGFTIYTEYYEFA